MPRHEFLQIQKIRQDGQRFLLYPYKYGKFRNTDFFVIATPEQVKCLSVGDTIVYEPAGETHGWFIEKAG